MKKNTGIRLDHINIRVSISNMLWKLLFLEVISAIGLFSVHIFSTDARAIGGFVAIVGSYFGWFFAFLVLSKIILTVYIVLDWLNEYYEFDKDFIYHRRGIIWTSEQKYAISNIQSVKLEQGLWGKVFNAGNLRFYDAVVKKEFLIYMIHNPLRYFEILDKMLPKVDAEKEVIREHINTEIDLP